MKLAVHCYMVQYKGNKTSAFRDNMQCRHRTSGEDKTQEHLEKCEFRKIMSKNLNLENEREHMIWWREINKALRELYRKANLNDKGSGETTTKSKATRGGRSSRIGQEPQGNIIDSPDENEESCYNICEGSTQAVEATSALDMSVECRCSDHPWLSTIARIYFKT